MAPFYYAIANGFKTFEWFPDKENIGWIENDVDESLRKTIRETALKHDCRLTVPAPNRVNLFSVHPETPIPSVLSFRVT